MTRHSFKKWFVPALLAVTTLATAHAKTLYVKTDSDDNADGESWATAYKTVSKALVLSTVGADGKIAF